MLSLLIIGLTIVFSVDAIIVNQPCSAFHVTPDSDFNATEFAEKIWYNRVQYAFDFVPPDTVCPYVQALVCGHNLYMSETEFFPNGTRTVSYIDFSKTKVAGAFRVGANNHHHSSPSNQVFLAYNQTFVVGHLCTDVPNQTNQSDHWLLAGTTARNQPFDAASVQQLVAEQGLPSELITIDQSNCSAYPAVHDL